MNRWVLTGLLILAGLLAGCGQRASTPSPPAAEPTPVPTAPPATNLSSGPVARLLDQDLLALGAAVCEKPPRGSLDCQRTGSGWRLSVAVTADAFARWTLRLPSTTAPLTGEEVLVLQVHKSGDLTPNLYFVQQDGQRTGVNLARFGLSQAQQELFIPLREVQAEGGLRPDFSQLQELQIVFEWADMRGELQLDALRIQATWCDNPQTPPPPASVRAPPGFQVQVAAGGLHNPTQLESVDLRTLLVSEQAGRVWRYEDRDADGQFERRCLYDSGYTELVGLLYDPVDGGVWLGGRGQLWRTQDEDRDFLLDARELRLDGLSWGRHQNNGLAWNPVDDPFTGEPPFTWLYFGLGSTEDLEDGGELNSTILRFPRTGQGAEALQVVSRGNRNAYDVVWAPVSPAPDGPGWSLFASENGPDFNDAPDEVNHIRWGHHYGFPDQFGPVEPPAQDGAPFAGPVVPVAPHASADGLAFVANPRWPQAYQTLYVALFGQVFSETPVGHTVDRIRLRPVQTITGWTFRGEAEVFVKGLDRPLALTTDPDGDLFIADYATGLVYRVSHP